MLIDTGDLLTVLGKQKPGCPAAPSIVQYYSLLQKYAEEAIKKWVKWNIEQATVTRYYDGQQYRDIALKEPYVDLTGFTAQTSNVWEDTQGYGGSNPNGFGTGSLLTYGKDYMLVPDGDTATNAGTNTLAKSGILRRLTNFAAFFPSDLYFFNRAAGLSYANPAYWLRGYGSVKATYTFGFPPGFIPEDIQGCVITAVTMFANGTKYGFPVTSENLGSHSYALSLATMPAFGEVRSILSHYRDLAIGSGMP